MELSEALEQYKDTEFKYGTLDCCLFVANVIRDVTGKDYAAQWRGRYDSEFGALRMVAEHKDLKGLASYAFGNLMPMTDAVDGNPAIIGPPFCEHDSIGAALGICRGNDIVYLTEKGLAWIPKLFGRGCFNV